MTKDRKIQILTQALWDIFWMARRYADGRSTYAPSMYNEAIKQAQSAGVEFKCIGIDNTIWALDGNILSDWKWPFQRYSDGPEYACPHGVGHSTGVHGCEGCCSHPSFLKETQCKKS